MENTRFKISQYACAVLLIVSNIAGTTNENHPTAFSKEAVGRLGYRRHSHTSENATSIMWVKLF